ncbi:MAG: hypothetical protein KDI45_15955 [Candidatus Accumulibacter sp.]|nr:hypothetical protein [Accumulibacter sp.]
MPPLYRRRKRQDLEMRPAVTLFSGKKIANPFRLVRVMSVMPEGACSFADP